MVKMCHTNLFTELRTQTFIYLTNNILQLHSDCQKIFNKPGQETTIKT